MLSLKSSQAILAKYNKQSNNSSSVYESEKTLYSNDTDWLIGDIIYVKDKKSSKNRLGFCKIIKIEDKNILSIELIFRKIFLKIDSKNPLIVITKPFCIDINKLIHEIPNLRSVPFSELLNDHYNINYTSYYDENIHLCLALVFDNLNKIFKISNINGNIKTNIFSYIGKCMNIAIDYPIIKRCLKYKLNDIIESHNRLDKIQIREKIFNIIKHSNHDVICLQYSDISYTLGIPIDSDDIFTFSIYDIIYDGFRSNEFCILTNKIHKAKIVSKTPLTVRLDNNILVTSHNKLINGNGICCVSSSINDVDINSIKDDQWTVNCKYIGIPDVCYNYKPKFNQIRKKMDYIYVDGKEANIYYPTKCEQYQPNINNPWIHSLIAAKISNLSILSLNTEISDNLLMYQDGYWTDTDANVLENCIDDIFESKKYIIRELQNKLGETIMSDKYWNPISIVTDKNKNKPKLINMKFL